MWREPPSLLILACAGLSACTGAIMGSDVDDAAGSGAGVSGRTGGRGGASASSPGGMGYERTPSAGGSAGSREPTACATPTVTVGAGNWRRLTQRQYRNTVKDLLGLDANTGNFLDDSTTDSFATNTLPPQPSDVSAYAEAAEALAAQAVADPAKLTGCNAATTGNDACAAKFIKEFGARAYRRELTAAEVAQLTQTYDVGKADGYAQGLRLALQVMLQSPSFLYLTEYGTAPVNGVAKLTSNEIAARLSYLLWNTTPDAALVAAAKAGELDTAEGIQKQAMRLMGDARFGGSLGEFFTQLLHANKLTKGTTVQKKDAAAFTPEVRLAMVDEVKAFVAYAATNGKATVKLIFTTPLAFPSEPLLPIYKASASQLTGGRLEVKDGTRSGLLTSAAFMAAEPQTPTPYGAVQRGHVVRTALLCDALPPPPANLVFKTPADADTIPQRTLLEQHKNNPTCAGCHTLMDPIGFGFENYDPLGRYRTTYPKGEVITASGEILGDSDAKGTFKDAGELAAKLGDSQTVRACLGTQWFRYAYGRQPTDQDACTVESFAMALGEGEGDLPSSLLSFVITDAFRFRGGVQ